MYKFEYLRSWGSYGTLINKRGVKKKSIIWILVWVWERTTFTFWCKCCNFQVRTSIAMVVQKFKSLLWSSFMTAILGSHGHHFWKEPFGYY